VQLAHLGKAINGIARGFPRVVTMGPERVVAESRRLAESVRASGYAPTHVVAIAKGGIAIAEPFHDVFPDAGFMVVTRQRAGTAIKERNGGFRRLVQRAPEGITTLLRRVEHWSRYVERDFARDPVMPDEPDGLVWPDAGPAPQRIVVVDDAVDTGLSIEYVSQSARRRFGPDCQVRMAVLTVSGVNPHARADYALMRGVNIRFFWSKDYRA